MDNRGTITTIILIIVVLIVGYWLFNTPKGAMFRQAVNNNSQAAAYRASNYQTANNNTLVPVDGRSTAYNYNTYYPATSRPAQMAYITYPIATSSASSGGAYRSPSAPANNYYSQSASTYTYIPPSQPYYPAYNASNCYSQ